MPYLGIFDESQQKRGKGLNFYLRLVDDPVRSGCVSVVAVDAFGEVVEGGYLLAIDKTKGTVTFHGGINPDLGFDLDGDGELMVE